MKLKSERRISLMFRQGFFKSYVKHVSVWNSSDNILYRNRATLQSLLFCIITFHNIVSFSQLRLSNTLRCILSKLCVTVLPQVLNMIVEDLFQGHPISKRKLKELLGHTPSQVLAGAVLGIVVSCVCCQGSLIAA